MKRKFIEFMMFLFVVCYGLSFSIVFGSYNQETSSEDVNINTALPTISNASLGSKPCNLEIKDSKSQLSQVVELFNNDFVHVVNISVSLSDTSHGKELLSDFHVQLMNSIGRKILFALDKFKAFKWTLTVGIRQFELRALERQNYCDRNRTNVTELVYKTIKNVVHNMSLTTKCYLWYSYKEISSGEEHKNCCEITKTNLLKWNNSCFESYLFHGWFGSRWALFGIYFLLDLIFSLCLTWLFFQFESLSDFDVEHSKYYKLEESRMSPSFFFFKIIWEENGPIISFFRVVFFIFFLSLYIWFLIPQRNLLVIFWYAFLALGCAIYCFLKLCYNFRSPQSTIKSKRIDSVHFFCQFPRCLVYDDIKLKNQLKTCQNMGIIKMSTVLCNYEFWKDAINTLHQKRKTFTAENIRLENRILVACTSILCYVLEVLFYLIFYVSVLSYSIIVGSMFSIIYPLDFARRLRPCFRCRDFLSCALGSFLYFFFLNFLRFALPLPTLPLLSGLALNLTFFLPYMLFYTFLIHYCIRCWTSVANKYVTLKEQIHEACGEIQITPNGGRMEQVVSKELYDKIRKELLPYDKNLFYFWLDILPAFLFAFFFLMMDVPSLFDEPGFVKAFNAFCGSLLSVLLKCIFKLCIQAQRNYPSRSVKEMVKVLAGEDPRLAETKVKIFDTCYLHV